MMTATAKTIAERVMGDGFAMNVPPRGLCPSFWNGFVEPYNCSSVGRV